MNTDENIKNTCNKLFDNIYEEITLLTPLIIKMKMSNDVFNENNMSEFRKLIYNISDDYYRMEFIFQRYKQIEEKIKETYVHLEQEQNKK